MLSHELTEHEWQLVLSIRSLKAIEQHSTLFNRSLLGLLIAKEELALLASLIGALQRLVEPPGNPPPTTYTGADEIDPMEL